jgi:23S rRNA A2030 N6-methylase RlmJ
VLVVVLVVVLELELEAASSAKTNFGCGIIVINGTFTFRQGATARISCCTSLSVFPCRGARYSTAG